MKKILLIVAMDRPEQVPARLDIPALQTVEADAILEGTVNRHDEVSHLTAARVVKIAVYNPAQRLVRLELNGAPLLARATRKSRAELNLASGQQSTSG